MLPEEYNHELSHLQFCKIGIEWDLTFAKRLLKGDYPFTYKIEEKYWNDLAIICIRNAEIGLVELELFVKDQNDPDKRLPDTEEDCPICSSKGMVECHNYKNKPSVKWCWFCSTELLRATLP